jgi:hypothetical protein
MLVVRSEQSVDPFVLEIPPPGNELAAFRRGVGVVTVDN